MNMTDLIRNANDLLGLPIDWAHFQNDEHYQQLFSCAKMVLNKTLGLWAVSDSTLLYPESQNLTPATLVYGVLAEYAFVAGMFNEWKVWQEKYDEGLFAAKNEKSRVLPLQ